MIITLSGAEGIAIYSRQTYNNLTSLTETATIRTSADRTISAGIVALTTFQVIVGPGGVHWILGCDSLPCPGGGLGVRTCIGIICPHNGGSTSDTSGADGSDDGDADDSDTENGDSDEGDEESSITQSSIETTKHQTTEAPSSTTLATTTSASNTAMTSSLSACSLISVPPEEDLGNDWIQTFNSTTLVTTTTVTACSLISVQPEQDPENDWTRPLSTSVTGMTGTGVTTLSSLSSSTVTEVSSSTNNRCRKLRRSNLLDRGANAETTRNEKGQSTDFSHLFKMPDFPFLFFLIHFRFSSAHSLPVFLFFFVFVSLLDRIDLKRLSTLLAAQLVSFHCSAAREILRQTATACDRVKHSVDEFDDVFGENIRFFDVYRDIGVTGH